ncbi:BatD family protein [Chitinophaga arvensicola]|uniref:Oxygen tolerance n=1 Tax=Chitinophaga arvensicola TaxID=29529 RepID=A0A1I0RQT4_9BACT|nr:BatD family protein [Chitinophaga arvensicola]SEW43671.1 Oxygen tolerance [Chitinophaga arvensicola]
MVKYYITLMYILCCSGRLSAQLKCFAKVELDRSDVYLQQPFKVTYTVLTATWYTQPPEFENIQIPGAFIVPFTKAQPGRFTDHGKDYSGIQFYYIVFPYKAGAFSVPAITIQVETPPEGSAVSSKVVLHTAPVSFVVKPVPKSFPAGEEWLVASDVTLHARWNKPLDKLKVGDVIERTITTDATGTLPQFIPALPDQKVDWADVYPGKVTLKDTRDDYNANGERVQTSMWLLTKAGSYELPAQKISWWNPYAGRLYTRTLPAVTLKIADNPGLGMLTTLQDSLAKASVPVKAAKKGPWMIAGMIWYKAVLYALALLLVLWVLYKAVRYLTKKINNRLRQYRESEYYWFRKFMKAPAVSPALYQWWDRWRKDPASPAVSVTLAAQNETDTLQEWTTFAGAAYGGKSNAAVTEASLKQHFRLYRHHRKTRKEHPAGGKWEA